MDLKDWEKIKYFSREENWGDASKMSFTLVSMLDALREKTGKPIVIHAGYATSGHSLGSYHYQGKAADFHITGLSLLDQYLLAESIGFGGIGVYPFWNNPGLHADIRTSKKATWSRLEDGSYVRLREEAFH